MRYAVISDIHGNMPAFSAVLRDAEKQNVDSFILLGDYCPCLPHVNEVIDTIRNLKNAWILKGNEDDYVLNLIGRDLSLFMDGQFRAIYWTFNELRSDNLDFLVSLPDSLELSGLISCTHKPSDFFGGTALDTLSSSRYARESAKDKYFSEKGKLLSSDPVLLKKIKSLPSQVFLSGHVHMQYHYELCGKHIVNPGSCGLPLDGKPGAPYTIVDISVNTCFVTERRVPYDISEAVSSLRNSSLYCEAPVWSEIIISELETRLEQIRPFLAHAEAYAKSIGDNVRPFTRETFASAYENWISGPIYGENI